MTYYVEDEKLFFEGACNSPFTEEELSAMKIVKILVCSGNGTFCRKPAVLPVLVLHPAQAPVLLQILIPPMVV